METGRASRGGNSWKPNNLADEAGTEFRVKRLMFLLAQCTCIHHRRATEQGSSQELSRCYTNGSDSAGGMPRSGAWVRVQVSNHLCSFPRVLSLLWEAAVAWQQVAAHRMLRMLKPGVTSTSSGTPSRQLSYSCCRLVMLSWKCFPSSTMAYSHSASPPWASPVCLPKSALILSASAFQSCLWSYLHPEVLTPPQQHCITDLQFSPILFFHIDITFY